MIKWLTDNELSSLLRRVKAAKDMEACQEIYAEMGRRVAVQLEADPYFQHWQRNRAFNAGKASLIY
jgi:phosphoribosylformimino-5-aminoimidazole carboxamide ribonucleotide (ProFAR) isomerase